MTASAPHLHLRSRRVRFPLLLLAFVTLAACGKSEPPAKVPTSPTSSDATPKASPAVTPLAALDLDPVTVGLGRSTAGPGGEDDVAKATAGITRLCDEGIARADAFVREIKALEGRPDGDLSWESTMAKFDGMRVALRNAGDFSALMAVSHPSEAVRTRAKACEPKLDTFETSLWLDAGLAKVVKRYAAKKETLGKTRARLLAHTLRDFHRNGLDLDAASQERLRGLNERLTQLGQDFDANLAASHASVEATPAELEGLPKEWLQSHPPNAAGKITISTDYPDYFPVVTYAKNRDLALQLYKLFDNRAADKNIALLDEILALRDAKARLLGYPTWADYVLEPRMAKDAATVAGFLDGLRKHLKKKGESEFAELRAMHAKLGGKASDPIPPSDRLYLEDRVRNAKYGLDSKEVSQYFEVTKVKEGLLTITSRMFGVRYRRLEDATTWHPDVEPMEVTDANGNLLGRFYFDLYPREGKYKHAAVFSIRDTVALDKGGRKERQVPIAAIECNFPKPSADAPALMTHQDVTTFFHEFGHVLHHVLSESEFSTFAGTSVARDFVESPSQMLEEWAWTKETLDLFAKHYATGKPLPAELFAKMKRSRSFGRALATERQLFLAALDQTYHTHPTDKDGRPIDTTRVLAEVNDGYTRFKYVPDTHFQGTFGHLIGYDAGYYGYQWALSIAQDLLTRFKKEGMLDAATAADYRAKILARGGSVSEVELVTDFLGRPPSDAAYKAMLLE